MKPLPLTVDVFARVRLFLMDVDGVLTDGKLWFGANGAAMKAFFVRDGLGIKLLNKHGIATGIVSGRGEEYVRTRAQDLGMSEIHLGIEDKGAVLEALLARRGFASDEVCYLGDDVNDAPMFARVGVPIAVANAHPGAIQLARYVTRANGGDGAVREVADLILAARGATFGARAC